MKTSLRGPREKIKILKAVLHIFVNAVWSRTLFYCTVSLRLLKTKAEKSTDLV